MDQNIYKFWQDQFMNLDKGRKQIEDMTRWIIGGLSGFEALSEPFCKFWMMDFLSTETKDYMKAWESTTKDFQKIFKNYLDMMGLVPRDEHVALINTYKDIKKTVNDQAEEISKQVKIVANQNKKITDQKKEIEKQKKSVADQQKEIASQKKLVSDLKKELAGHKELASELKKEVPIK
jgi:DNA repair exonuclease SbcCD ATPase subunit